MKKKIRIPVPEEIAAEIQFISDRTCCVCSDRAKAIQIHHIDENPSNNSIENLCVLYLECHDQASLKGGFGRKLDAAQIRKYSLDWIQRVKEKREKIDEYISIESNKKNSDAPYEDSLWYKTKDDSILLERYIKKLPDLKKAQHALAEVEYTHGYTMDAVIAIYDLITFYEEVLAELATYFPQGNFDANHPRNFFSQITSDKFSFYYALKKLEPDFFIGSYDKIDIADNVMRHLDGIVPELVKPLMEHYLSHYEDEFIIWQKLWLFNELEMANNEPNIETSGIIGSNIAPYD